MVRSASLSSGIIKFAPNEEYVNNLNSFRLALRPNKYHWKDRKPALSKSLQWLHEELWKIGGKPECRFLVEYGMADVIKLILDVEWFSVTFESMPDAFQRLQETVLGPVNVYLEAKTGRSFGNEDIVISEACRQLADGTWKMSFHVSWKDVCVRAGAIYHLIEHLELPDIVDRSPFRGKETPPSPSFHSMLAVHSAESSFCAMQTVHTHPSSAIGVLSSCTAWML